MEGGRIAPAPGRDTLIGRPVALYNLPSTYRSSVRDRHRVTPEYLPGLHAHPMKVLALVQAGTQVRLVVPATQRPWMRLFYSHRRLGA
ncbi:MAG: hypothetical protein ICV69_16150 [Thermoleophilaceae bacterium]|nr:hypothetical protein [Thermoleophilaceae bacterium]